MEEKRKVMDVWMKTVMIGMKHLPGEPGFVEEIMGEGPQDEVEEEKQGSSDDSVSEDIPTAPIVLPSNIETDEDGNVYLPDSGIKIDVQGLIDGYSGIKVADAGETAVGILSADDTTPTYHIDSTPPPMTSDGYYPNLNPPPRKDRLSRDAIDMVVRYPVHEQELRGFDHLSCNLLDGFVVGWMGRMGLEPFMTNIVAEDELGKQMQEQLLTELWELNDNGDGTSAIREIFLKYAKFRLIEHAKAWLKNNHEGD